MKQTGFSLIELMVGIVVGLLVVLAATGGASFYEANRRSTMGGNGAQENATAAANYIQKEARMAGFWVADFSCKTIYKYNGSTYDPIGVDASSGNSTSFMGSAVDIATGSGTNNSDSIELSFAYSPDAGGDTVAVLTKQKTGSDFEVTVTPGVLSDYFAIGDTVLLAPPPEDTARNCTMGVITQVQDSASHLQMRPYGNLNGQPSDPILDFPINSRIAKLQPVTRNTLRISNNNFELIETDVFAQNSGVTPSPMPVTSVLAENVVKMLARYASNTSGTGLTAAAWPPSGGACTAAPQLANNAQSYVLSVILVARSAQPEKHEKTSSTDTGTDCNASTTATLPKDWDGNTISMVNSADPTRADGAWQCYRYKASRIDIPMRNLILQGNNGGCKS